MHPQREERRSTTRIPVNSVLLYRAIGMDHFESCYALTVSTKALEIISEHSIPMGTIVTIAVKTDESSAQRYRVHGEVAKREQLKSGWRHIVTASSARPWSSMFLYDVMCSIHKSERREIA